MITKDQYIKKSIIIRKLIVKAERNHSSKTNNSKLFSLQKCNGMRNE